MGFVSRGFFVKTKINKLTIEFDVDILVEIKKNKSWFIDSDEVNVYAVGSTRKEALKEFG